MTGTAIGVLFLGTLSNGLAPAGVESYWQQVATGVIVVVAGIVDKIQRDGLSWVRLLRVSHDHVAERSLGLA